MELNTIFSDRTVFAENLPIRVFGTGDGCVKVSFLGETAEACSFGERWEVELAPREAGGPYEMEIELDGEKKVLSDVYVGKVYLIAGQSNAEFQLVTSNTSQELYRDDPLLRNYFVSRPWIETEALSSKDGWLPAKKETVGVWSAIGYLAGESVRNATGKAVGLISCYQGASVIESWLPREIADGIRLPDSQCYIDHYYPDFTPWNGNGIIYETMLKTFMPFAVNGVVWYQGESDTTVQEAAIYDRSMELLFACVRDMQRNPELPFVAVQIADYDYRKEYGPDGWKGIQLAQERAAQKDGLVKLVKCADICESSMIHPVTKNALAERIAFALL